jgi:DNA processing protein
MQISSISYKSSAFPDTLRQLDKVPKSINVLGELPTDSMVAIVGSRRPTDYGKRITYQFASELAQAGAIIVSGLALGVDSIAHRAALDAGGKTVAVLGHGLDQIYPSEHRGLAKEILAKGGALVSEYDVGVPPYQSNFVERNRIIAALSLGVLITEAAAKSGSLFTARDGGRLGRTVMAVPGSIHSKYSAGPNNLLRGQNAIAVTSAADCIVALGFHAKEKVAVPAQSPDEALLLRLLGEGVGTSEELISASKLGAAQFANIISLMEITGKVRNLGAGNWVVR